jgi:hypothetical protein
VNYWKCLTNEILNCTLTYTKISSKCNDICNFKGSGSDGYRVNMPTRTGLAYPPGAVLDACGLSVEWRMTGICQRDAKKRISDYRDQKKLFIQTLWYELLYHYTTMHLTFLKWMWDSVHCIGTSICLQTAETASVRICGFVLQTLSTILCFKGKCYVELF